MNQKSQMNNFNFEYEWLTSTSVFTGILVYLLVYVCFTLCVFTGILVYLLVHVCVTLCSDLVQLFSYEDWIIPHYTQLFSFGDWITVKPV
jgi:hypothetical protein